MRKTRMNSSLNMQMRSRTDGYCSDPVKYFFSASRIKGDSFRIFYYSGKKTQKHTKFTKQPRERARVCAYQIDGISENVR